MEEELDSVEFKDLADEAIRDLNKDVDLDSGLVLAELNLTHLIFKTDYLFIHLGQNLPKDSKTSKIMADAGIIFIDIKDIVEKSLGRNFHFIAEERELVKEAEVKHKIWKLVIREQEEEYAADLKDIEQLHKYFEKIKALCEEAKKEEVSSEILNHFETLVKFIILTEEVFRDSLKKERALLDSIEKKL